MKFQRIDEDTIRCIINKQDMQEYGIKLEDFFKDKSKVHDFLHDLVERAQEEVGYTPKNGMLSMQIMPISQNIISITFSEKDNGNYSDMLDSIKNGLEGVFEEGDLMSPDEDEPDNLLADMDSKDEVNSSSGKFGMLDSEIVVIGMDDIDKMADFCRALNINKTVTSELIYLDSQELFFLIIEKNRLSMADMKQILILAIEYTSIITDDNRVISHIREYGDKIIEKSAYRILKNNV
ncbi:MAG: adaptor protein MecA [Lachnospiraceae bacterium]|nr:adaptor protein MecA [Lachnospiraceae bacterium]